MQLLFSEIPTDGALWQVLPSTIKPSIARF